MAVPGAAQGEHIMMNDAMKEAWMQVVEILDQQPSRQEFDAFLRTWQLAIRAEREICARVCDQRATEDGWEGSYANACAAAIRARGQA